MESSSLPAFTLDNAVVHHSVNACVAAVLLQTDTPRSAERCSVELLLASQSSCARTLQTLLFSLALRNRKKRLRFVRLVLLGTQIMTGYG